MYLAVLGNEEKELFFGVAYYLATVDGVYSDEEKAMIEGYSQEMQVTFIKEKMAKPIEDILKRFNEIAEKKTKKIVVFESIGLAMADNNYDDRERTLVTKMESMFGLENGFVKKCEMILNEYVTFQTRINQLILE